MKIYSINPYFKRNVLNINNKSSLPHFEHNKCGDVISFSAKKYDADSIVSPTNHCAYCGCKVYSEAQLEGIAKDILGSKADRLNGKVKSVLEKLEGAKNSLDLSTAKRLENVDELQFFKNFLEIASKKSFLKGAAIFEQVYDLDNDNALELLMKNLHPLLKTIDHVSPQREEKENLNSDINLVEACYCCNHDLKKGVSFAEFYAMYPSIKDNMPSEKFQYAASEILDSSQNGIMQRLSATNLLKTMQRLFVQRTEAVNYLDSVDFRIKRCDMSIESAIQKCFDEISEKQRELEQREQKLASLKLDSEYTAILERIDLEKNILSQDAIINNLVEKKQRLSSQINELRNGDKKSKNKKKPEVSYAERNKNKSNELTEEQKQQRILELKNILSETEIQRQEHVAIKDELAKKLEDLVSKYPTVQMLQHEKSAIDGILNAYEQTEIATKELDKKSEKLKLQEAENLDLTLKIQSYPESYPSSEEFPEDVQSQFSTYKALEEALIYLDEHPNGGALKVLINDSARRTIVSDMDKLSSNPLVIQYLQQKECSELKSKSDILIKSIEELKRSINSLQKDITRYSHTCAKMTRSAAQAKSIELANDIRRVTEKEQHIKLPQIVATLKAEILLINSTIADLRKKQAEIQAVYS